MKKIIDYIFESVSKVYLMVGLPDSGKSEWCQKNHPNLPVVSRDIIRAELGFTKGADEKVVLSRADSKVYGNASVIGDESINSFNNPIVISNSQVFGKAKITKSVANEKINK